MTEIQHPNMFAAYQQGYGFGNEIKKQRTAEQELAQLRGLAPGIMQGDPNALAAAGAINPKAAGDYDAIGVDIAKRATGAATFLMEAVKRGNPQEIEGRYRQVKPFLDKVAQTAGKPPAPDTFDPAMVPLMEQLIARSQGMVDSNSETPSGYRQFEMTAAAAGLKPGTPEYQQAANIALGREGRAATGGFGFELIKGADGRERMARKNPRTGAFEVYDEGTGDFVPMGGGGALNGGPPPMQAPAPQQFASAAGDETAIIEQEIGRPLSPAERAQIAAGTFQLQVPVGQVAPPAAPASRQWTQNTPNPYGGNPGLGVGRSPEEQAALTSDATERAKGDVELEYLPRTEAIKSASAMQQAFGIESGKQEIERDSVARVNGTALRMYETGMSSLTKAMDKTTTGPLVGRLPAVTASQQTAAGTVDAMAPILKGLFRTAGEGTFTDKDQELLLGMMPTRKDLPEARAAKIANIDAIVRAKLSAQSGPQRSTGPRRIQNASDYDALPSGATYIAPDGSQRRKR